MFGKEPVSKYNLVSSIEITTFSLIPFESNCCCYFLYIYILKKKITWNYINSVNFFFAEEIKENVKTAVPWNVKGK